MVVNITDAKEKQQIATEKGYSFMQRLKAYKWVCLMIMTYPIDFTSAADLKSLNSFQKSGGKKIPARYM